MRGMGGWFGKCRSLVQAWQYGRSLVEAWENASAVSFRS